HPPASLRIEDAEGAGEGAVIPVNGAHVERAEVLVAERNVDQGGLLGRDTRDRHLRPSSELRGRGLRQVVSTQVRHVRRNGQHVVRVRREEAVQLEVGAEAVGREDGMTDQRRALLSPADAYTADGPYRLAELNTGRQLWVVRRI